jgi:uncharacterized protein (TIGR03435 family)
MTWDGGSTPVDATGSAEVQPTIFGALQSQLGLKLERKKAPFEVLVVNHFEKIPTEN